MFGCVARWSRFGMVSLRSWAGVAIRRCRLRPPVSVNQFLNRADRANHNPLRYRTNRPQKPQQRLQRPQRMKRRVALSTPISQEQLSLSFAKRLNIETTRGHPPAHMREQMHLTGWFR